VYRLLLLHLRVVAVEDRPQAVAHFVHDTFTRGIELREVVGLLHQRIEGPDLEVWYRKGGRAADI
jgi:hypothetical protein